MHNYREIQSWMDAIRLRFWEKQSKQQLMDLCQAYSLSGGSSGSDSTPSAVSQPAMSNLLLAAVHGCPIFPYLPIFGIPDVPIFPFLESLSFPVVPFWESISFLAFPFWNSYLFLSSTFWSPNPCPVFGIPMFPLLKAFSRLREVLLKMPPGDPCPHITVGPPARNDRKDRHSQKGNKKKDREPLDFFVPKGIFYILKLPYGETSTKGCFLYFDGFLFKSKLRTFGGADPSEAARSSARERRARGRQLAQDFPQSLKRGSCLQQSKVKDWNP